MAWLSAHTYGVVFVATLIDATAIPFPGRILLAAAGAVAATGEVSAPAVIALGAAGVLVTDHRLVLRRLTWAATGCLRLYCRLTFSSPDCARRADRLVQALRRADHRGRVASWPPCGCSPGRMARRPRRELSASSSRSTWLAALAWTSIWVGTGLVPRRPVVPGFRRGSLGGPRARSRPGRLRSSAFRSGAAFASVPPRIARQSGVRS